MSLSLQSIPQPHPNMVGTVVVAGGNSNQSTIYYSTNGNFAVPLEQVQVIGSTAPNVEELKQAVLQFGD